MLRAYSPDFAMGKPIEQKYRTVFIREDQKFVYVGADQTEKIYDHLKKLATQFGIILSCTPRGDLLLIRPNVNAKLIGTIEEERPAGETEKYEISFKGRERFAKYRAIASSSKHHRSAKPGEAIDKTVKAPRVFTFKATDSIPGEAKNAAEWRKNKAAADSLSIPFPVNSWYGPDGKLWQPNTIVTVISPTIGVPKGYNFLISQVELDYKKSGTTGELKLIPPSFYTTGEIDEPWK
jgi:prophage tail gpP-like protein